MRWGRAGTGGVSEVFLLKNRVVCVCPPAFGCFERYKLLFPPSSSRALSQIEVRRQGMTKSFLGTLSR